MAPLALDLRPIKQRPRYNRRSVAIGLVCVGLAGGCGESAAQKRVGELTKKVVNYKATRPQAETTLSRLNVPPGFVRVRPCPSVTSGTYTKCFARKHSIVLNQASMTRLIEHFGAKVSASTLRCFPIRHSATTHQVLSVCASAATLGADRLIFDARLPEADGHPFGSLLTAPGQCPLAKARTTPGCRAVAPPRGCSGMKNATLRTISARSYDQTVALYL